MSGFVVRKPGYSVRPWRIVADPCPAGDEHRPFGGCCCEMYAPESFDHPMLGVIGISSPLAFDRKRDAVAALAALSGPAAGDET